MIARRLTNRVKKVLKGMGVEPICVKSETTSFSGLGYGEGCTCKITLGEPLDEACIDALSSVQAEFRDADDGPVFHEDQKHKSCVHIKLGGSPYPLGFTIPGP